ncbi:hypothetical protein TRFO_12150 [Tritrichomonas foetus]|uniref:Importin N-terminal domain-containing protein n=1 Tax=Tritrichomonas foetus TaxID=1144522 RepID=A0A1J4J699_9EUKA|nr:hypothetical protein TRFO_12150 [Tritrichomonas foetus]|eukprot:OHS92965.1 hypothetical protein TRFO_12150 [Tritrichomonas foetus]
MEKEKGQIICRLYEFLQNPAIVNANEVTQELMNFYSDPSTIYLLCEIIRNINNNFIRKQAIIGINTILTTCFQQLHEIDPNHILQQLFQVLLQEQDIEMFSLLLKPLCRILSSINHPSHYFMTVVPLLEQTNFEKTLIFAVSYFLELPLISKEVLEYGLKLLKMSFEYPQKLNVIRQIFLIYSAIYTIIRNEEISFKDDFTEPLSNIFIEFLHNLKKDNGDLFNDLINMIDISIQPLQFQIVFPQIVNSLKNPAIDVSVKPSILYYLGSLLECEQISIDLQTIEELLLLSINISIISFEISVDSDNPDSCLIDLMFQQVSERIPNHRLREIILPTYQNLCSSQNNSCIYTSLMLIDSVIKKSPDAFIDIFPVIVQSCIHCFNSPHHGVLNMAIHVFSSNIGLFINVIEPNIDELIGMLLSSLQNDLLMDYYHIIYHIIVNCNSCDSFFEMIYLFCSNKIKSSNYDIVNYIWIFLGCLFRNSSSEIALPHFHEIFVLCKSYLSQNEPDPQLSSLIIECIGSLAVTCSHPLKEHINEVLPFILNNILNDAISNENNNQCNNYKLTKSSLNCLKLLLNYIPRAVEGIIDSLLDPLLRVCEEVPCDFRQQQFLEYNKKYYLPNVELLICILKIFPKKFNSPEKIAAVATLSIKLMNGILEKQIILGANLFIEFINIINDHSIIHEIFPFILDLANKESFNDGFLALLESISQVIEKTGFECVDLQAIFSFFCQLISKVENDCNQYTNEKQFNEKYINKIEIILTTILGNYPTDLISVFLPIIPQIMNFFNEEDERFHAFAIELFVQISFKASFLLNEELLAQLVEKSLNMIVNSESVIAKSFVFFLISLNQNFSSVLAQNNQRILHLVEYKIKSLDASQINDKITQEFLITLFIVTDKCSGRVVNTEMLLWILSLLPINLTKRINNRYIYDYLISIFSTNPDLHFPILRLFLQIFISKDTLVNSNLSNEQIKKVFGVIASSGILNNQEAVAKILDEQTENVISLYETLKILTQRQ